MRTKAESKRSKRHRASGATTSTRTYENPPVQLSSATVESHPMPNGTTWPGRSRSCENSTLTPRSSKTSAADSTSVERDLSPYWNDYTEELSSVLWLPTKTALHDLDSTLSGGRLSETAAKSWFSAETITALSRSSPRIFSPSCIPSPADSTDCGGTGRKSRKIRLFPTREQEQRLNLWIDAARWCYNETVARLNRTGEAANWKKLKVAIIHSAPGRLRPAPYAVKDIAVRDACRAVSAVRKKNRDLGKGREAHEYHRSGFRSRKHPRQGCYAKADAVKPEGWKLLPGWWTLVVYSCSVSISLFPKIPSSAVVI